MAFINLIQMYKVRYGILLSKIKAEWNLEINYK